MEGEVRHALESNPEMDIVMLHFIYDPFIPMIARRQMPDVILNHERVANHYLIPSINLCQEIGERMQNGEFTWDEFGGTHPKPFGHKFYAAAIGHLFDEMWKGVSPEGTIAAHDIPAKPLDAYSYYNGDFIALEKAHLNKGWKLVDNWHPDNKAGKRNGFVDVPMLEATRPGDRLTLDFRGKRSVFSVSAALLPGFWNTVSTAPHSKNWILSPNGATIFISPGSTCWKRNWKIRITSWFSVYRKRRTPPHRVRNARYGISW